MKNFTHNQPTKVIFGVGNANRVGEITAKYGTRCLMVAYHPSKMSKSQKTSCDELKKHLELAGLDVFIYYGAIPNPTTECVDKGIKLAKKCNANVVLAVGGGSVIDAAKVIAFCSTNPSVDWDLFFSQYTIPFALDEPLNIPPLPLIAIPTTSGTGSQVTQAAIITDTATNQKTGIFHSMFFPKVSIVDPKLMVSVPPQITAETGFDAFSHAFESFINRNATPYSEILSLEAIRLIIKWLPEAIKKGSNLEAREGMALADTLAGISLANAGTALPHPLGETIGSLYPHIPHGRSLAVIYPEFMRFACSSTLDKFATIGRLFNPLLNNVQDEIAAEKACGEFDEFLKKIGLWLSLKNLNIQLSDLENISKIMAPITLRLSPRPASEKDLNHILNHAYQR
ncbi:MAG TPA: iron-containing alcohol dehydrogenase [Anaerolineae bacterium]|nr:iron-containing alcohol dehydrogenase [Anaerolineae bacterium]